MSKQAAAEHPPPYSGQPTAGGHQFPPQNAVHPTQASTPGQTPGYAYPAQPGYGQAYGGQQASYSNTTFITQPTVTVLQVYRESPVRTTCIHCQTEVVTATCYETGTLTWLACFLVCLLGSALGCFLGCCLIPFCINGCKDVVHSCPNCRQQIARYNRI